MMIHKTGSGGSGLPAAAGFTLIELVMAMVILVLAIGGLVAASTSAFSLHTAAKENLIAKEAAVQVIETVRSYALDNFALTFRKFDGTTSDDPTYSEEDGYARGMSVGTVAAVAGSSPPRTRMVWSVAELAAIDPQALVSLEFPGNGTALYEDMVPAELGGPMDLNGNGVVSSTDVSGTYNILPVTVTVSWRSKSGRQITVSYYALLGDRR